MIEIKNLTKTFKVAEKDKGFWGSVKGLFKRRYHEKRALDDVSFSIDEGEIVGYLGPNGAGKSTTIKIMCGILTPSSGDCKINGFTPWKDREKYVKDIGVVFGQRSQLWWDVPVIDSFHLLKDIYKLPKEEFETQLNLLVEKLDLKPLLHVPLRQLSLGQKMKCELAGSLLHKPKILFLDEPTIGLDAISKLKVREFVKTINKEMGITVILTTHDMNDIEALTNRIIIIGKGKLLYDGSFDQIKYKYSNIRTIEIEMEEDYGDIEIEGCEFVSKIDKKYTFKTADKHFKLTSFVEKLSKKYKMYDVNIDPINLEEVISKLYEELGI
ncbi:MAG: ABC transporter ATP-binding protein [Clostridia bacterium]|nr:ABC transporter ATP-binding protein [Clostridia bacterium]